MRWRHAMTATGVSVCASQQRSMRLAARTKKPVMSNLGGRGLALAPIRAVKRI
jgi:hypothetical protein